MNLILPRALRGRIEEEARRAFPRECCGLIEGRLHDGVAEAIAIRSARNIASRGDRFEIDPEDHFAALKAARASGRALIGCYHSHPNGLPCPSATDREGAGEEDFIWLIAALKQADGPMTLAAFIYSAAGFSPCHLAEAAKRELAAPNLPRV